MVKGIEAILLATTLFFNPFSAFTSAQSTQQKTESIEIKRRSIVYPTGRIQYSFINCSDQDKHNTPEYDILMLLYYGSTKKSTHHSSEFYLKEDIINKMPESIKEGGKLDEIFYIVNNKTKIVPYAVFDRLKDIVYLDLNRDGFIDGGYTPSTGMLYKDADYDSIVDIIVKTRTPVDKERFSPCEVERPEELVLTYEDAFT